MARVIGRRVLPSDMDERRVLRALGVDMLRVPRGVNPFLVSRRLQRAAHRNPDVLFLADVVARARYKASGPSPTPDSPDAPEAEGVADDGTP